LAVIIRNSRSWSGILLSSNINNSQSNLLGNTPLTPKSNTNENTNLLAANVTAQQNSRPASRIPDNNSQTGSQQAVSIAGLSNINNLTLQQQQSLLLGGNKDANSLTNALTSVNLEQYQTQISNLENQIQILNTRVQLNPTDTTSMSQLQQLLKQLQLVQAQREAAIATITLQQASNGILPNTTASLSSVHNQNARNLLAQQQQQQQQQQNTVTTSQQQQLNLLAAQNLAQNSQRSQLSANNSLASLNRTVDNSGLSSLLTDTTTNRETSLQQEQMHRALLQQRLNQQSAQLGAQRAQQQQNASSSNLGLLNKNNINMNQFRNQGIPSTSLSSNLRTSSTNNLLNNNSLSALQQQQLQLNQQNSLLNSQKNQLNAQNIKQLQLQQQQQLQAQALAQQNQNNGFLGMNRLNGNSAGQYGYNR
jgi:hypothetical protein